MTKKPRYPESSVVVRRQRENLRHKQQWRSVQMDEDESVQEL